MKMWLKLLLLLVYILLLFILTRILEAISWCESGYGGSLTHRLLDPMVLSVARLKALLEHRGVSYEGVVEKSELASLVDASGQVSVEEAEMSQTNDAASSETNFTSGAHFIEQVEDAKDSVWLVQVVSSRGQSRVISSPSWNAVRDKVSKFGVRTGFLDCSLDMRYCSQKGWHSPFLLLALPSQFEKKASVAMYNYSGSVRENAIFRWVRDKLDEKVQRIEDPTSFRQQWQDLASALEPEIHAVLFTHFQSAPLFYSALSVKFPGRVKFGLVCMKSAETHYTVWKHLHESEKISTFPAYVIYTAEKNYTYGMRPGEHFSFPSMEKFLKCLYPSLNDIFIISFCVANFLSWFELFISNCPLLKRLRKFMWCVFKYNIAVIMLWLPVIGIFQMPYLDRIPLLALKMARIFNTSSFGTVLRGDYSFYLNHPSYVIFTFAAYLILITVLFKKYGQEEQNDDDWFNFNQMRTHAYLRPNDLFEPMRFRGYDLLGGLDVFGTHLSQPSLWLRPSVSHDYIKHLPTWRYSPVPLATRAAENSKRIEGEMSASFKAASLHSHICQTSPCTSVTQYSGNGQHENTLGKTSQLSSEEGTAPVFCYPSTSANSCDACALLVSSCTQPQKFSPALTVEPIKVSNLGCKCCAATPSTAISEHSRVQAHSKHYSDHSKTSSNAEEKVHHCSSETSERSRLSQTSSMATVNDTSTMATESFQTCQSNSEPNISTAHRNPTPTGSSYSNGSGFPTGYLESHQCVICLDEYAHKTVLCGLPCGHVFHEACIIAWFNREKHFCPMCRWPSYKIHPLLGQRLPFT